MEKIYFVSEAFSTNCAFIRHDSSMYPSMHQVRNPLSKTFACKKNHLKISNLQNINRNLIHKLTHQSPWILQILAHASLLLSSVLGHFCKCTPSYCVSNCKQKQKTQNTLVILRFHIHKNIIIFIERNFSKILF